MKNSRRFLMIIILILIPFFVSCNNNKSDDELDQYGDYNFMSSAFSNINTVYTKDKEVRRIYFDTEGYNYYGDFKILIDDTVIFDMADYDYFLPATDNLCIPVDINPEDNNKIRTIIGDGAINMANEFVCDDTYDKYSPGEYGLGFGYEALITGLEGLKVESGNNKIICKGISNGGIIKNSIHIKDFSTISMEDIDHNLFAILSFTVDRDYTLQKYDIINNNVPFCTYNCYAYEDYNVTLEVNTECFSTTNNYIAIGFLMEASYGSPRKYILDLPDGVYIKDVISGSFEESGNSIVLYYYGYTFIELSSRKPTKIDFTITRVE